MFGEPKKAGGVVVGALYELKIATEMALGCSVSRKRLEELSFRSSVS